MPAQVIDVAYPKGWMDNVESSIAEAIASLSIDESTVGAPLATPRVYEEPTDAPVVVDLDFDVYEYKGPNITQPTRSYNGQLVGPIIRVRPGQTLKINLNNKLAPELCDTSVVVNDVSRVNMTSLHTHGLHISGLGSADNALTPVPAGTSREYVYDIPADHMGGTFWYHPHTHGAGAMQVGGGAFGMLIVEDDAEAMKLPKEISDLEEIPLVLTHMDMPWMRHYVSPYYNEACLKLKPETTQEQKEHEQEGRRLHPGHGIKKGGKCNDAQCADPIWGSPQSAPLPNTVLVNGQTRPRISMVAGRWYRWRLLLGSGGGPDFRPHVPTCEMALLAKDGVWLPKAPRPIKKGFMAAGMRADWIVRCPIGTHSFVSDVHVVQNMRDAMMHKPHIDELWELATIEATPPPGEEEAGVEEARVELAPFSVVRPCYLADMTQAKAERDLTIDMRSMYDINRHPYVNQSHFEYDGLQVGSVIDYTVFGLGYDNFMSHVFHVHVNPFQLVEEPIDDVGGYFQKGDWHDTLKGPQTWKGDHPWKLRTNLDRYSGAMVAHCHFLWHQDVGMMVMLNVGGEEGTRFTTGRWLDPTCYMDGSYAATKQVDAPAAGGVSSLSSSPTIALGVAFALVATVGAAMRRAWRRGGREVVVTADPGTGLL